MLSLLRSAVSSGAWPSTSTARAALLRDARGGSFTVRDEMTPLCFTVMPHSLVPLRSLLGPSSSLVRSAVWFCLYLSCGVVMA